jgi:riboflavin kinase, archaea type
MNSIPIRAILNNLRNFFKHFKYTSLMDRLRGIVGSGMGKGKEFLGMDHYRTEIFQRLGFWPIPGTLNIHTAPDKLNVFLGTLNKTEIEGFNQNGREFGSISCYACSLNGIKGAIAVPQKTSHSNVAEFICDKNLREKLNISDGEEVTLEK